MSAKKSVIAMGLVSIICSLSFVSSSFADTLMPSDQPIAYDTVAQELGWVPSFDNSCGGYYLDQPFTYPVSVEKNNLVELTGEQGMLSQRGTSTLEGKVTITRYGQQITSNKAFLYRDPATGKLTAIDLIGNVHLREPNTLILAKEGRYHFDTNEKSLRNILYRTSLNGHQPVGPHISDEEMEKGHRINTMTAWGKAESFSQNEPKIYELSQASFTTCPPINPTWRLKASHIVLNKNTGRGYATHARIVVKSVPVFYLPYISFSIDNQRKTGFLWPRLGVSNVWGPYFQAPFYWNMAPNYDMTITPGVLTKRGGQLSDNFRYLTSTSSGNVNVSVLPNDRFFSDFQAAAPGRAAAGEYGSPTDPVVQSEVNRLENASDTRRAISWQNKSQYNDHWSSNVDFNYVGDDYYLRDFGSNLNDISQNQLLQQGDLNYKGENWNFIGRLQAYQTLHPVDEAPVSNAYRRFPQLVLNGDYPNQPLGLEYFINNEVTHYELLKTPGSNTLLPIGNRLNTQPGISWPYYTPYFYFNPRLQGAFTNYNLSQTEDSGTPNTINRGIPIFDIASGLSFYRDTSIFGYGYEQTLEPQVYYTYIPYHYQQNIPVFDTSVTNLTYDQIFNYNRFSGLDRIGDANQIGVGVATRWIDQETGLEKVRLGVGDIIYFADRRVTLCNTQEECTDYQGNPNNHYRLSPVSGVFDFHVSPIWKFTANTIWNPITKQVDTSNVNLNYQPEALKIINLGYGFARNGDPFTGINVNTSENNLKLTDVSFSWPLINEVSAVGRWSHDWNTNHFQNMMYGLQYDTCCWAVRAVAGRTFTSLDPANNSLEYNSEFYIQFALKGLGNVGNDPSGLLSSITGYNTKNQFGQEL